MRHAFLVATGEYEDVRLSQLRAPQQDVVRLAALLEDPEVGAFDNVVVLQDPTDDEVRRGLAAMLSARSADDMVLVYFSCHGITNAQRRLFFATRNTDLDNSAGTSVPRTFVSEQLQDCLAASRVLLLDCCFSGAFVEGFKSHSNEVLDAQSGAGYVVLTASNAYEYAYEEDTLALEVPTASIFTDVLIQGISSGDADIDGDGWIGASELFTYIQDAVQIRQPGQTPRYFAYDANPNLRIAKAGATGDAKPSTEASKKLATYSSAHIAVARGIRAAAEPISRTLGPLGRRAVITGEDGRYHELADAAMIAALFRPDDIRNELGASYVRDLVRMVHLQAGDGAASAVAVARAMITAVLTAMRAGAHPIQLRRGVELAAPLAERAIQRMALPLNTMEQAERIATSSSADSDIGKMIATAMDKVGKHGLVVAEESNGLGLELGLTEGMRFDRGYISGYFITDPERQEAVLLDPYILILAGVVKRLDTLLPTLEKVMEVKTPLVVIADDVVELALATLVVNKVRDVFNSVAVATPQVPHPPDWLEDIAILTGARAMSIDDPLLRDGDLAILGRARKVVVSKESTAIIGGTGDPYRIQARVDQIRHAMQSAHPDTYVELQDRLARLAGGVAMIAVGALTEDELHERKARVERAILATQTAAREGIVPGGGVALIQAGAEVAAAAHTSGSEDFRTGMRAVATALRQPLLQIATNGGIDAESLTTRLERHRPLGGFDVHTGIFAENVEDGVIDSAGVVREIIRGATQTTTRFLMLY